MNLIEQNKKLEFQLLIASCFLMASIIPKLKKTPSKKRPRKPITKNTPRVYIDIADTCVFF